MQKFSSEEIRFSRSHLAAQKKFHVERCARRDATGKKQIAFRFSFELLRFSETSIVTQNGIGCTIKEMSRFEFFFNFPEGVQACQCGLILGWLEVLQKSMLTLYPLSVSQVSILPVAFFETQIDMK